jgi:colanic acid biosynthesis glycosyl transferase WcaI
MRLNIHDYSGHPFQIELSRELAARGHEVVHGFSTQYVTGHGRLSVTEDDPSTLRIEGLTCDRPMIKYSPVGRTRFELSYATAWQRALDREDFDLVVACNIPMLALDRMRRYFARRNQPWLLWHQDLYSLAVGAEAARRLPGALEGVARRGIERIERKQVSEAAGVVVITEAMVDQYRTWGVDSDRVQVQNNWAPLSDITPRARENEWAREHSIPSEPVRLMYAGTLGRKHNPLLLLELLDATQARGVDAQLIVASEGDGADLLRTHAAGRPDVHMVGFQPAESFADMLGCADAVIALLEPDAARFSVPSKVLSYLSAGRAIIALLPEGNPAAHDVSTAGGFVGSPTAEGAHAAAGWVQEMAADPTRFAQQGAAARRFAEQRFDIGAIGDRFEKIFSDAAVGSAAGHGIVSPRVFDGATR